MTSWLIRHSLYDPSRRRGRQSGNVYGGFALASSSTPPLHIIPNLLLFLLLHAPTLSFSSYLLLLPVPTSYALPSDATTSSGASPCASNLSAPLLTLTLFAPQLPSSLITPLTNLRPPPPLLPPPPLPECRSIASLRREFVTKSRIAKMDPTSP